jgi:N-acetylglucosamine malate deacetylase 1
MNGETLFNISTTALVLAPHTDDGEFGCGGTIARLIEDGVRVVYVAFSAAEESVPAEWDRDVLRKEVKAATRVLGLPADDCVCLDFRVRHFPAQRQEILEAMVRLHRELAPQVVFLPSRFDTHQDHSVVSEEGFRAFKTVTMLGYEVPWNNLEFRNNCFIRLEQRHIERKIEALRCYASQRGRNYAQPEFIRALAITRGIQVATPFAECFEVIRCIA